MYESFWLIFHNIFDVYATCHLICYAFVSKFFSYVTVIVCFQFNDIDLQSATAEAAAQELSKPTTDVKILTKHNIESEWLHDTRATNTSLFARIVY